MPSSSSRKVQLQKSEDKRTAGLWTVAEWNRLLATIREAPSVDTHKARLCSIKLYAHFIRNKIA